MGKKKEDKMIEVLNQMPDSFRYFRSFYEAATMLEDNIRLKFYDAINEYVFIGKQPSFSNDTSIDGRLLNMAWLLVKPVIDKSIRNSNGGRNSGGDRPSMEGNDNARKQHENNTKTTPIQLQNNTKTTPIQLQNNRDKDMDMDKDMDKEESTKKNRTAFVPPTLSEVSDYISEKGYKIDAEAFVSFYSSNGWMVGRNKMKDWKMALVTWTKRDNTSREKQQNPQPQQRKTKVVKTLDDLL